MKPLDPHLTGEKPKKQGLAGILTKIPDSAKGFAFAVGIVAVIIYFIFIAPR
ncbi:MAG: hypothetical protein WCV68_03670 [Candidatus Paceibacterota bacterium]|jgi:hypothetical protein